VAPKNDRHRVVSLVAVGCVLAAGAAALATDYYVDGSVPTSGDGSIGSPFKTIAQGLNAAQPGDNVVVRAGTYTQTSPLMFPRSGQLGLPITLRAAAGEQVLVQTQPGLNINLVQTARSYITVEDITFDGNYSTANGLIRLDPGGAYQTFRRCEMRRQGNHLLRIDSDDLLVEDCHIHHAIWPNSPSTDAHTAHSQTGLRHTFRRCDMHHATGDLWQGSRDPGAWGDIVFDMHIELADDDCNGLPAGTAITENHWDTKVYGTSNTNFTVRYCTVRGGRYCRILGAGGAFNLKEMVTAIYIYNNLIYNNDWAFRLRYPSTDYHVYNNLVYDNNLAVRFEDGISNLTFLNNTFYNNGTQIQDTNGPATSVTWKNNIFAAATSAVWRGTFLNNLFWSVPAGWPTGNGNLNANPSFANAAAYDLHLAAGSAAVDTGLTLAEVTDDVDGDPRPVGTAYDIGADEFRFVGDINADGHVDAGDLLLLAGSFGLCQGESGYERRCNLSADDCVDVSDLLVLAADWGA
jgi:hypothetical protein